MATVLLETGRVPMQEPETRLTLEAPGGLVEVQATCRNGRAEAIRVRNLPSFADRRNVALEAEGFGTLTVDTAFGGDSFVLVDAQRLGFALTPDEARDLATVGTTITAAANEQLSFSHPELADWRKPWERGAWPGWCAVRPCRQCLPSCCGPWCWPMPWWFR